MEDAHVVLPQYDEDTSLFAIFDGHGGEEVAIFCAKYFPIALKENENYKKKNFSQALSETFEKMDQMQKTEDGAKELNEIRNCFKGESNAGCTALVLLLHRGKIYVANAGDCRSLLLDCDGTVYRLNKEHKPQDTEEFERIQ